MPAHDHLIQRLSVLRATFSEVREVSSLPELVWKRRHIFHQLLLLAGLPFIHSVFSHAFIGFSQ